MQGVLNRMMTRSDCSRISGLWKWRGKYSPGHDGLRAQGANRLSGFESQAYYRLTPAPVMTGSPSSVKSMQPVGGQDKESGLLCYGDKVITIFPDRPNDTGEFIGQSNGGNIMTSLFFDSKHPSPKPVWGWVCFGTREDGAGAMDKKHAQISIPPFGDTTEAALIAAGVFPGSESEEAGEVAGCWESMDIANKSDQGSGGQKADSGDGTQLFEDGVMISQRLELPFNGTDTSFELSDFISHISESRPQQPGDRTIQITDEILQGRYDSASAGGDGDAEFPEDSPGRINPSGPVGEVFGPETMKGCEGMLIGGFDGHGLDVFVTEGFENALGVGPVGFVTDDVGADGVRWEKDSGMSELLELASPVMSGAAGFENDRCGLAFGKETLETRPGEPMMFTDLAGIVGYGDLEDGFSEINGDCGSRVHIGLLLSDGTAIPKSGLAHYDADRTAGGVHFIT